MEKEIANQIQEAQSPKQEKPREKHAKTHTNQTNKDRIVKAAREKQQVTYKGNLIHLTADLSTETLQARREWQDIFKRTEREKPTTKITVPGKDLIQN